MGGVRSTNNRWAYFEKAYASAFREGVEDIALGVEALSKQLAPVDTGTLRASIHTQQIGNITWVIIVGVDYGKFVEYGTVFMDAIPFLRPAFERSLRSSVNELVSRLKKVA